MKERSTPLLPCPFEVGTVYRAIRQFEGAMSAAGLPIAGIVVSDRVFTLVDDWLFSEGTLYLDGPLRHLPTIYGVPMVAVSRIKESA